MAGQRTTVALVLGVLGGNYGSVNGITVELQGFIKKANLTVNQSLALASKMSVPLSPTNDDLEMMERWLAAYNYTANDKQQANQSTAGASATFVVESLDPNTFKAGAIQADPSGMLDILLNRKFASTYSLGACEPTGPILVRRLP